MRSFDLPVGYHTLHPTKIIDYQLNRWHSLGYARLDDMRAAASRIKTLDDWKGVMLQETQKAEAEGRIVNAAFYLRAAEFFTAHRDPDKLALYNRFLSIFYKDAFPNDPIERFAIPYQKGTLPALRIRANTQPARDTLVMHGGFDSFIEEFYSLACHFANHGIDVVLFEGPGQGGALRNSGLPLEYAWEKPASAVLDFFDLDSVTWLGISMGGWLCFRAAAFEPRIARVIALSIAFDYMQIPPPPIAAFARWLFRHPQLMERLSDMKMRRMPQERWGIDNLQFISHTTTALDAGLFIAQFNEENQQPQRVRQDLLILTGAEDHFVPLKMHHLQVAALTNAHSISERIFTRADHAANHCQVGNMQLALDSMLEWMDQHVAAAPPPILTSNALAIQYADAKVAQAD